MTCYEEITNQERWANPEERRAALRILKKFDHEVASKMFTCTTSNMELFGVHTTPPGQGLLARTPVKVFLLTLSTIEAATSIVWILFSSFSSVYAFYNTKPMMPCNGPIGNCSANGRNGFQLEDVYVESPSRCSDGEEERVVLGRGAFGDVYRACLRSTNDSTSNHVAIKKIKPSPLDRLCGPIGSYDDVESRCQEVRSLQKLRGQSCQQHIVQLYEYFWDGTSIHLVLEMLPANFKSGPSVTLRAWLRHQRDLAQDQAKAAAQSILNGLLAMHTRNIVHRDITESNVLFGLTNDLSTLKICGFGSAKDLSGTLDGKTKGFCGTFGYLAPEIYMGRSYGCEVDLFSFGVVLFRILSGRSPWSLDTCESARSATCQLQYDMNIEQWEKGVSPRAALLVRDLLVHAEKRATAKQALKHAWFGENIDNVLYSVEDGDTTMVKEVEWTPQIKRSTLQSGLVVGASRSHSIGWWHRLFGMGMLVVSCALFLLRHRIAPIHLVEEASFLRRHSGR